MKNNWHVQKSGWLLIALLVNPSQCLAQVAFRSPTIDPTRSLALPRPEIARPISAVSVSTPAPVATNSAMTSVPVMSPVSLPTVQTALPLPADISGRYGNILWRLNSSGGSTGSGTHGLPGGG